MSSPSYGNGPAQYAHYCSNGYRETIMVGGGRYIGGGRYSRGLDTDEPAPDLPEGYYAERREVLITNALVTHKPECACMLCTIGKREHV